MHWVGGHLQIMLNFPEIVPRNMYHCGSKDDEGDLYVIIFLDINGEGVGEGYCLAG